MDLCDALSQQMKTAFTVLQYDTRYSGVQRSSRPELCQFQCNGAMALAKSLKQAPMVIAQEIVKNLPQPEIFSDISVVAPGFINLTLADDYLANWLNQLQADEKLGCAPEGEKRTVIIDYGGANVAKPMHVGHMRSLFIGDSLKRLYRFCGDTVIGDIHLGDWGTQMGMLIEEIKKKDPSLPYFDAENTGPYPTESPVTVDELAVLYPQASARCKADAEEMEKARQATAELQNGRPGYRALWRHMVDESIACLKVDLGELGVTFDLWKGESDVHALIAPMVEKLLAEKVARYDDGAVIIDIEDEKEDIPPLMLLKSDGAVMYASTDLATIEERVANYPVDLMLYVVDKRQSLHFKQVFYAAKKGGVSGQSDLIHVAFGTVNGKDGKSLKTRSGGNMRLNDLIQDAKDAALQKTAPDLADRENTARIIALAAMKFADLANPRLSDYIFDMDKFLQYEGKTGPYILYSAVRIKSMLRTVSAPAQLSIASAPEERDLQIKLTQLPEAVQRAYQKCEPHHLCDYAYTLAQTFNVFYGACPIAKESDEAIRQARLALCAATLKQLTVTLDLLGLEVPEKM
jgi:arginyl-tRNA synthetase